MAGCIEHGKEASGSIKREVEPLSNYDVLQN
jgi:hypothetical protein